MRLCTVVVLFAAAVVRSFASISASVSQEASASSTRLTTLARRFATLKQQAAVRREAAGRLRIAIRHREARKKLKAALLHRHQKKRHGHKRKQRRHAATRQLIKPGATISSNVASSLHGSLHSLAAVKVASSLQHKRSLRHGRKTEEAAGATANVKALHAGTDVVSGVASRRPIITGCLKECQYKDQSCVTQCQVCVEKHECRVLGECDTCLNEANAWMHAAKKMGQGILDDGGASLRRDGLLAELTQAKMVALESKRALRNTREGVLTAQREAEYAIQERRDAATKLAETRRVLKGERLEVTRWKLQNEKKLKAMRARAREERQERQKAERAVEAAKLKHREAKQRLRIASNENGDANETEADETTESEKDEDVTADQLAEQRQLEIEVEKRQQAVEQAERDVEKTSADGEWLDRGLRRRVKSAQGGARKAREELLVSRAHERVSQERLEDAKLHYVTAVKSSQQADKAAEQAELELRRAPTSLQAEQKKADSTVSAKEGTELTLHSAACWIPGSLWLSLLTLFSMRCI